MWPYAQCNPNKGQGELIKSNSPTSAHQLAPAPLRHAQDLTVMRRATQLIPCPPPPASTPPFPDRGEWGWACGAPSATTPAYQSQFKQANSATSTWPPNTMGVCQDDVQTRHPSTFSSWCHARRCLRKKTLKNGSFKKYFLLKHQLVFTLISRTP